MQQSSAASLVRPGMPQRGRAETHPSNASERARRSYDPTDTDTKRFIRAMSVQIPILQQAVAKLDGPGDPFVMALFLVGWVPTQSFHL